VPTPCDIPAAPHAVAVAERQRLVQGPIVGVDPLHLTTYDGTLALLERHRRSIPFGDMVSHRFDVTDAAEAMARWMPTHPPRC
jgi:hypothetical protein